MDHFWVCASEEEGARSPSLCSISVNRAQLPHQYKSVSCLSGKQRSEPDPEGEQGTEVQVQLVVFKNQTYILSVDRTKMRCKLCLIWHYMITVLYPYLTRSQ